MGVKMVKTKKMKKVFKVTTGYQHVGGYDRSITSKNVLADTPLEAVGKVEITFENKEVKEVLESVELVCVIDIE